MENPSEQTTASTEQSTPPSQEKFEVPKGKVLVDEVTLSNILSRLQTIEGQQTPTTDRVVRALNHTARVRFTDEAMRKMVVGYGRSWEKNELGRGKFLIIEVLTRNLDTGKEDKEEVEYVKFMEEGKFLELEIVKVDKQEINKGKGTVNQTRVDYNGYRTEDTGHTVPLKVMIDVIVYTLQMPDGTKVEVPEAGLN